MKDCRSMPAHAATPRWPDLLVNSVGRSIGRDLETWLRSLSPGWRGATVTLVAGYVSIRGLISLIRVLRELIDAGVRVQLLLGVAPTEQAWLSTPWVEGGTELRLPVEPLLEQASRDLRAEVDEVPFTSTDCLALLELCHLLRNGLVRCRRYERGFLHGKATVLTTRRGASAALVGSANLTLGGLRRNLELVAQVDRARADQVKSLASRWWDDASDYDLAELVERRFRLWPHPLVYLRMLRAVYGAQVNTHAALPLRDWQKDGVAKALSIIDRIGGVLIADDVGLGKTYEGGEIIRYGRDHAWGPALVVCPAHLRDAWKAKLTEWQLSAYVISYSKLNLVIDDFIELDTFPQYGLIICDEAHYLRTPTAKFLSSVRTLIAHQHTPPRRVLLTATPVNNYGRDLYELLALVDLTLEPGWVPAKAHTHDRTRGRSREGARLLQHCERADELPMRSRKELYGQLDQLIVRRTRPFIAENYPDSGVDFPDRECIEVTYAMSRPVRRLMGAVLDAIGADTAHLPPTLLAQLSQLRDGTGPAAPLTLAAYELAAYARGTEGIPTAMLAGLMRVQLCKRIESSPAALATTVTRLAQRTEQALTDLDNDIVRLPSNASMRRLTRLLREAVRDGELIDSADDVELEDVLSTHTGWAADDDLKIHAATGFDKDRLRADLRHDAAILHRLRNLAWKAIPFDTKRDALVDLLATLAAHPHGPKVLILAGSRVTTTDLGRWLAKAVDTDDRLAVYRGRMASLGDVDAPSREDINHTIAEFTPITAADTLPAMEAARLRDRYDLLIGTDILAEGLNLQQAALLVHYDLPWNPQTLGQRAGRLDRIGALHNTIHCYTVLPDTGLDLILGLLDRLRHKASLAAATIGQPTALFPDCPVTPRDFATALAEQKKRRRSGKPYIAEQRRAWLAQALRVPAIAAVLDTMPAQAGTLSMRATGHTFCFAASDHIDAIPVAQLCHIYSGQRDGATVRDTTECLNSAHTPLTRWLKSVRAGDDPVGTPVAMPDDALTGLWNKLNRARLYTGATLGIPEDKTAEALRLTEWVAPASSSSNRAR